MTGEQPQVNDLRQVVNGLRESRLFAGPSCNVEPPKRHSGLRWVSTPAWSLDEM